MPDMPLAWSSGWQVIYGEDTYIHVVPRKDSKPHTCARTCVCGPWLDQVGLRVYVHNAADGRERFEDLKVM